SPDFSASGTCLAAASLPIIQPGGTCTIIITFSPTAGTPVHTPLNETLIVQSDGTSNVTIMLSGMAMGGSSTPQLSPNPFTFPNPVRTGQSQTVNPAVILSNPGTASFQVTGSSNATDFSIAGGTCFIDLPTTLNPDASCTIGVTFAPLLATPPGMLTE